MTVSRLSRSLALYGWQSLWTSASSNAPSAIVGSRRPFRSSCDDLGQWVNERQHEFSPYSRRLPLQRDAVSNKLLQYLQRKVASLLLPTEWLWLTPFRPYFFVVSRETGTAPTVASPLRTLVLLGLPVGGARQTPQLQLQKSVPQTARRSVYPFLSGLLLWPADTHRPRYICSSRPHLALMLRCGVTVA